MKNTVIAVAALALAAGVPAGAQDLPSSVCPPGTTNALGIPSQERVAQDACQQAYDLYQFLAPQLGLALAGGNATLGTGSTLGGLGHFSVGVRGNVFSGNLPQVQQFTQSTNGAQRRTLPAKSQLIGLPTADAAIGVFGGLPLGLTNVGGIDLLVSASYVPDVTSGGVSVKPDQNLQLGYGARLGLLQESLVAPGVSVTFLQRDLPTTTITGTSGGNTLTIRNASVKTKAFRAVASKSLLLFSFAAGVGQDRYDQSADISATVSGSSNGVPVSGTATVPGTSQSLTRTNYFLDAALNLPLFKIVGEVGQATGGTVRTYNSFSTGRADQSQTYFSAGLRFGF